MPRPSGRWQGCWSVMARPSSPGSPRNWAYVGFMKVGTTRSCFPYVAQHQKLLEDFLGDFWDFYRELLAYRQQPTPGERKRLERRFDALFATKTGYWALDERIGLTRAKKTSLPDGAGPPGNPAPQQLGGTGRKTAGAKAEDRRFGPRLVAEGTRAWDHLHVPGWDHPEVGSELLPLTSTTEFPGRTRYRSYPASLKSGPRN